MEARGSSFVVLGGNSFFIIPYFQRPYIWKEEEWADLLDTLSNSSRSHFLGSIVLKVDDQNAMFPGDYGNYIVVDGQQRLTTVSILIRAIYDKLSEETRNNNSMKRFLFNITNNKYITRVRPSYLDSVDYTKIIVKDGLSQDDIDGINEKSSNIMRCYKYFYQFLSGKSEEENLNLFNTLISGGQNIIVLIILSHNDSEQEIFDSVNNKGVPLTSSDTIKNDLFNKALLLAGDDEIKRNDVMNKYKTIWESFFYKSTESFNFWDANRTTGRINRSNMDVFFSCYAIIKKIYEIGNESIKDLAKAYKSYIQRLSYTEIIGLIDEIYDYAQIYSEIFVEYDGNHEIDFNNEVKRLIYIFNALKITTWYPYVLFIKRKFKNNPVKIDQNLSLLEKYVMRSILTGVSTKNFNKECASAINGSFDIEASLNKTELSNNSVKNGINYIKSNNYARIALFIIELSRRQNERNDINSLEDNYTLEHIMPQDYTAHWNVDVLPVFEKDNDGNLNKVSDHYRADEIRSKAIYSLGNMTLLKRPLNSSIKNSDFKTKVEGTIKYSGYKEYGDLKITRDDILNDVYNKNIEWNEAEIKKREDKLFQEIIKIW